MSMQADLDIMHGFGLPAEAIKRYNSDLLLKNLYICSAGHYLRARSHDTTRPAGHEHDDIILYCISGKGWFAHLDEQREMKRGDLIILPRAEYHGYGSSYDAPWSIYYAHYRGLSLPRWYELIGLQPGQHLIDCTSLRRIPQLMEEMYQTYLSGINDHSAALAASCLNQIFALLADKQHYQHFDQPGISFEIIHQYMHEHIYEHISLADLAKQVDLSVTHFSRLFHNQCGLAPIDYFIRLKMHQAAELLHHTELSIVTIADTLGYEDPYYFSRIFKKIYGQSPKKHRQLARLV